MKLSEEITEKVLPIVILSARRPLLFAEMPEKENQVDFTTL